MKAFFIFLRFNIKMMDYVQLSTVVILLLSIQNISAQHLGNENKLESK